MFRNRFYIICFGIWIITGACSSFFFIKRNQFGNYTLRSSYDDLYPQGGTDQKELTKWQKSWQQYSSDEKEAGKKLSAIEAGIEENEPVLSKTVKIGEWLIRSFWDCPSGQPVDSVNKLRPIELYKVAKALHSPVWCGTYSSLFLFFCICHNITCRYIESIGGPDHHVVNECYIPELRQWIIIDLTHKILNASDDKGNYLNSGDIIMSYKEDHRRNINVLYMKGISEMTHSTINSIKTEWEQYLGKKNTLRYYYVIDLKMVYTAREKIKRYLFPGGWYEIFPADNNSNTLFYIRSSLLFVWLLISIFIILKFFIFNRKH